MHVHMANPPRYLIVLLRYLEPTLCRAPLPKKAACIHAPGDYLILSKVQIRLVGLRVSVSHDLAAVPDACAYAENTCP